MAFSDPQTVTVNAVPYTNARVSTGENRSSYKTADGLFSVSIAHSYGKKNRSVYRVDLSKIAADPFTPALNQRFTHSAYLVYERPPVGFTTTEQANLIKGLVDKLLATTYADVTKVVAGES